MIVKITVGTFQIWLAQKKKKLGKQVQMYKIDKENLGHYIRIFVDAQLRTLYLRFQTSKTFFVQRSTRYPNNIFLNQWAYSSTDLAGRWAQPFGWRGAVRNGTVRRSRLLPLAGLVLWAPSACRWGWAPVGAVPRTTGASQFGALARWCCANGVRTARRCGRRSQFFAASPVAQCLWRWTPFW